MIHSDFICWLIAFPLMISLINCIDAIRDDLLDYPPKPKTEDKDENRASAIFYLIIAIILY